MPIALSASKAATSNLQIMINELNTGLQRLNHNDLIWPDQIVKKIIFFPMDGDPK